jgi:hypothetical protein
MYKKIIDNEVCGEWTGPLRGNMQQLTPASHSKEDALPVIIIMPEDACSIFMQDNDFMYRIGVGGFGSSLGIYKELA